MRMLVNGILADKINEIILDLEFSQSPLCLDREFNVRIVIMKLRSLLTLAVDEDDNADTRVV